MSQENNFGQDLAFLNQHVKTIVLDNGDGSKLVCIPDYQGRIMTSTASGDDGQSLGYINYDAVASDSIKPQINLYGGEDRIWVSPEGGQFSVFFEPGVEMDFAHWRTPAFIDSEPFELIGQDERSVSFRKDATFKNFSGFEFCMRLDRQVALLRSAELESLLNISLDGIRAVGHQSHNTFINSGDEPWLPETGLIGAWAVCMSKPSADATVLVPFRKGSEEELGKIVTADYFGQLDSTRLQVIEEDGLIYFLGDGDLRSKLGVSFQRSTGRMGSWDAERGVLSVVDFNLPESTTHGYTNNLWEIQDDPYCGDVLNGYNDGPNDSGEKFGGFFELETMGPALALAPGEAATHVHTTLRLQGERDALTRIAKHVFGVSLERIESQVGA